MTRSQHSVETSRGKLARSPSSLDAAPGFLRVAPGGEIYDAARISRSLFSCRAFSTHESLSRLGGASLHATRHARTSGSMMAQGCRVALRAFSPPCRPVGRPLPCPARHARGVRGLPRRAERPVLVRTTARKRAHSKRRNLAPPQSAAFMRSCARALTAAIHEFSSPRPPLRFASGAWQPPRRTFRESKWLAYCNCNCARARRMRATGRGRVSPRLRFSIIVAPRAVRQAAAVGRAGWHQLQPSSPPPAPGQRPRRLLPCFQKETSRNASTPPWPGAIAFQQRLRADLATWL